MDIKFGRETYIGDLTPHAKSATSGLTENYMQCACNRHHLQAIYFNPPPCCFTFLRTCTDGI